MNFFDNPTEKRLRAPFRLSFFILGMVILWIVAGFLQSTLRGAGPAWLMSSTSYIIVALLATVLVYLTGKWVDMRSFSTFGFFKSRLWYTELIEGVMITTGVVMVVFGFGFLIGAYDVSGWRPGLVGPGKWIPSLTGYFIMMVCVGYYEELLFRGYLSLNLFEGLQRNPTKFRAAALGSILIISAFFALVHGNNPNTTWLGILNILLAGFMLGIPYFISGSLATSIGIHFAWNFVQGPILGLPVSGIIFPTSLIQTDSIEPFLVSGGSFGLEGGLLGTMGILSILILVMMQYRKRYVLNHVHPTIMAQSIIRQS